MVRTVPEQPEPEPAEELQITIRIPRGTKLRTIVQLEEAMSAGVGPVIDWLVAHAGCNRDQLLDTITWEQIDQLRTAIREAVQSAGRVPPRTS